MNKLVNEVQKTIQEERKDKELETEKGYIRDMLDIIERDEKEVKEVQKEIKMIKNELNNQNYDRVIANGKYPKHINWYAKEVVFCL